MKEFYKFVVLGEGICGQAKKATSGNLYNSAEEAEHAMKRFLNRCEWSWIDAEKDEDIWMKYSGYVYVVRCE